MKRALVLSCWVIAGCSRAWAADTTTFEIDARQSELFATVDPDLRAPFWTLSGGQHVIEATAVFGFVALEGADVMGCRVRISVPVASLEPDRPRLRERLGLEEGPNADDRAEMKATMEGQLWIYTHPTIRFEADKCRRGDGQLLVEGTLEVRGIKKQLSVPVSVLPTTSGFIVTADFTVEHADFDMEPYANALGTIQNAPTIGIHARLVAVGREMAASLER